MSVTYMLQLEEEPETYEQGFTALTSGVNECVYDWVSQRIEDASTIIEVGAGTGKLARMLAKKQCKVLAVDRNPKMVEHLSTILERDPIPNLKAQRAVATNFPPTEGGYDAIVSTFLLSELRPFEQQMFLQRAWTSLKENGKLVIAAEFIPRRIARVSFFLKRWWYGRKLRKERKGLTHPLRWFLQYLGPLGFQVVEAKTWKGGAIRAFEIQKMGKTQGYYIPPPREFTGFRAWLGAFRCILTGQIDHISIEPGLYKSGNPSLDSPVIVTANYSYTHFRVMRALRGTDAWVLCVDSNGINVWCGARGGNFGNDQLIEAIKATCLVELVESRQLLLPQLAAGGVAKPRIPPEFPFSVRFGPVWAKDIPEYLQKNPVRKPEKMRIVEFNLSRRLEAGLTHATFLLRKFVFWPSILLLALYILFQWSWFFLVVITTWISVLVVGMVIATCFPLMSFTRKFVLKGLGFAVMTITAYLLLWRVFWPWTGILTALSHLLLLAWLTFFSTMSFSGYTMTSSVREIQAEYPLFAKIHKTLLISGLILYLISLLFSLIP